MTNPPQDIFGGESRPSVSFKDAPIGTSVTFVVTEHPNLTQARDYETGQPAFWPDGNPKQTAVINGTVNGEERSLWAMKPSALFSAIGAAQKAAQKVVAPGDTLVITYTGDKPNEKNPRLNAAKQYSVTLQAGSAFTEDSTAAPTTATAASHLSVVKSEPVATPASGKKALTPEQFAALAATGMDMSAFEVAALTLGQ